MKQENLAGSTIDRFCYDTPTYPQEDFYALCDDDKPLVMVFLPNYGHPVSRIYLAHYIDTLDSLKSGRLACVVRSDPLVIAQSLKGDFPFTLICDMGGVLYDYFNVVSTTSRLSWSLEAIRIFHQAEKQGYQMDKGSIQQLPLTLVVGREGKILFSHYGKSLTDMPEDCEAVENVCVHVLREIEQETAKNERKEEASAAKDENEEQDEALEPDDDVQASVPVPTEHDTAPEDEISAGEPVEESAAVPVEEPAEESVQPDRREPVWQEPLAEDTEKDADMDTLLVPEESAEEPAKPSPDDPKSWNKLLGMFAEDNT